MTKTPTSQKPSLLRYSGLIKALLSRKRIYNGIVNRFLDYKLGIETRVVLEKKDFGIDPSQFLSSNRYEGTAYYTLKTVFSSEHYPIQGKSLIDIGSGKGRVLFYTLSQGAKNVMGIEHSPKLNEFFHANEEAFLATTHRRLGAPQVFQGSFQDFQGPLDFDYIFLSNPFNADLFKVFLGWLFERIRPNTKMIYYSPQHCDLLLNSGAVLEKEIITPFTQELTQVFNFPAGALKSV